MKNENKKPALPVIGSNQNHHIGSFSFLNQAGKTVTEKDIVGKVCVVEYFFATCKGMCPKMNKNMQIVYEKYKGDKRVKILSHTVDPVKDSVEALKKYSLQLGADPYQWYFLTGDKKQLYDMARYSYLISAVEDTSGISIDNDFIHDKHFVLVDGKGRLRGFYDGLELKEMDRLNDDIKKLLEEK